MRYLKTVISNEAPNVKSATAWIKPVQGGVALYVINDGKWQPLKLVVEENDTVIAVVEGTPPDLPDATTAQITVGNVTSVYPGSTTGVQTQATLPEGTTIVQGNALQYSTVLQLNALYSATNPTTYQGVVFSKEDLPSGTSSYTDSDEGNFFVVGASGNYGTTAVPINVVVGDRIVWTGSDWSVQTYNFTNS